MMEKLNRMRWKKKNSHRSSVLSISILTLLFFLFLFVSYKHFPKPLYPVRSPTVRFAQCGGLTLGEKFLWYAPHSGFSNQLSEFKNAILMAAILNRTLIVPPVLDHHAVALGSCPKFRVLAPNEIRLSVWDHEIELIRSRRYISMADIIDLSSMVSASVIKTIDFRVFVSLWCGLNINFACFNESDTHSSVLDNLKECGSLLSGHEGNIDNCLYTSQEDCRTTVWTYQQNNEDILDSFQPDQQLQKKKKISYVRKRRDVYKTLGPGSEADSATVLSFGSLFTAPYKTSELYIDIHESPTDARIQSFIKKIEFLPFVPAIMSAGKEYGSKIIKAPFLCAQLRLLDGQFKNHWKATFAALKQKVESLKEKGTLPIHIFVMTDLPKGNWTGNYLGNLARDVDSFKLYFLREEDELVIRTAKTVVAAETENSCPSRVLPDILLYIEEAVCSCASFGFVGTAGSTIADSIESMRKFGACSSQSETSS